MTNLPTIDALVLDTVTGGLASPDAVRPGKFFRERLYWAGASESYVAKRLGSTSKDFVPPAPYENCRLINRTLLGK
jgi:hypothetical protein